MLSSRYLHLHEALGLGPMWLKKDAQIIPVTSSGDPHLTPKTNKNNIHQAIQAAKNSNNTARLATISTINTPNHTHNKPNTITPTHQKSAQTITDSFSHSDGHTPYSIDTQISLAQIMIISVCPSPEDSMNKQLFSGSVGALLDNILISIGLETQQAHKTCWVKTAPLFKPNPEIEQINAELPQMQYELKNSQARAILFLGQFFEQAELLTNMQQLCNDVPYFIIPHPARLLRQPQLKAQAWAELKKLKAFLTIT